MKRAALLVAACALVSCDDFDDLLCKRTGCDAGVLDAGLDAGAVDAGGLDAGTPDAGTDDAGRTDAGVALSFGSVMHATAFSDTVPILGFVAGDQYTLLAVANRAPLRTLINSQTVELEPWRPTALGLGEDFAFLGRDGGVDYFDSVVGVVGPPATTTQPLLITALSGLPDAGVLVVGTTPSGTTAWGALSRAGPSAISPLGPCPMRQVELGRTNAFIQYALGLGAAACGAGVDHLYAGRWVWGSGTPLSLADAGEQVLSGTSVHAATNFSESAFLWQDGSGLRLARARNGDPLQVVSGAVAPLRQPQPVESDLALTGSADFVLALTTSRADQAIEFTDGGTHALEPGIPLVLFGTWDNGVPVVTLVRALRLGHGIDQVRLAHSVNQDLVFLAGLCQSAARGVAQPPCDANEPRLFVVRVDPL